MASPQSDEFVALIAGPFRRELLLHCYRMLGSFQDAEDTVQDALVRAWRSAEVADLLDTTPVAVNSALQRARAQLAVIAPVQEEIAEPENSDLLERYVAAFEKADVATLTQLLRRDAIMEMPPWLTWLAGRDDIARFLTRIFALRKLDAWRMLPTAANRQPAVGAYVRADDGTRQAQSLQVYTMTSGGIVRIVAFSNPSLFPAFGLPTTLSG